MLPKRRLAWASWNYRIKQEDRALAGVTYNMSLLQQIESPHTFCVTLNGDEEIDPTKILQRYVYHHPVFTLNRAAAQARHSELLNSNRTSFCGAYWGNGFHEDGVVSALAVVRSLTQGQSGQSLSANEFERIGG
jgi:predicted NAD/FAD-binding protein